MSENMARQASWEKDDPRSPYHIGGDDYLYSECCWCGCKITGVAEEITETSKGKKVTICESCLDNRDTPIGCAYCGSYDIRKSEDTDDWKCWFCLNEGNASQILEIDL